MSQLRRHVTAFSARIWTTAQSGTLVAACPSAAAQDSLGSLACPLLSQSRSVHVWTSAASPADASVHQDAAKERQNASISAVGHGSYYGQSLTRNLRQAGGFHSSASAAANDKYFDMRHKQNSSGSIHKGGPDETVAAKESWPSQYRQAGRIEAQYKIPRKPVFAVIELGATQYKVSPGDLIVTEKLRFVDVNDKVKIQRVFMLGSRYESIIGRPLVPGAFVTAAIEEQFQDAKVLIFKKRRRKNSRRLKGHRQDLTSVKIIDIVGIEEEPSIDSLRSIATELEEKAA